jgi:hypothetical protein
VNIDALRGTIAYITAAIVAVGGGVLAYQAWVSPIPEGGGRDIAILYGLLGLIIGGAVQFLFGSETRTQATKAAERTQEKAAASMPTMTMGGDPPRATITPPADRQAGSENE